MFEDMGAGDMIDMLKQRDTRNTTLSTILMIYSDYSYIEVEGRSRKV